MKYKRIVAKFGTNLLTGGTGCLNHDIMGNLVQQIATLHDQGHEIIMVSSGAVGAGRQKLNLGRERKDIPFRQVLASVGQSQLMNMYEKLFSKHNIVIAQALLTKRDLSLRAGYLNARNTLLALMELGVICVVNENDVVATDEIGVIQFGDNDNLSAMVANLIDADILVMLTDTEGLYTANPQLNSDAKLISKVSRIDARIQRLACNTTSTYGIGGMTTKIAAAKQAMSCGMTVVIASGKQPENLIKIANGEGIGTWFVPSANKLESKKRWMLSGLASRGKIIIDDGATKALKKQKKSLLPAGIVETEGKFKRGDVVDLVDKKGKQIGNGITNYSSKEIAAIKGVHSSSVQDILGHEYGSEIIHRNNMVLM